MTTLAETQLRFREAVIQGDTDALAPLVSVLVGGRDPQKRVAVHQRNYRHSLVEALLMKFPATAWLMGTSFVMETAEEFVRQQPPTAPCIAEYGAEFPAFLSQYQRRHVPYLRDFAKLEWCIDQVAIAVDRAPVPAEEFSRIDSDALPDMRLSLQSGLRFVQARWPVDELMKLYLKETAPAHFDLAPVDAWIEVRGARGQFDIIRLKAADFIFRKSISEGHSIGDAAESALDFHPGFHPGQGLAALMAAGLVTEFRAHENSHDDL
jgi:hypothetical protein